MISSSNDMSFSCKSKVEGEVVGSIAIGCVCGLPLRKNEKC